MDSDKVKKNLGLGFSLCNVIKFPENLNKAILNLPVVWDCTCHGRVLIYIVSIQLVHHKNR